MTRDETLAAIVDQLVARTPPHPVRVAVDGIDAAGKTTLADDLAPLLRARGRAVIRASADDFQRPRALRYARGRLSPEGYYEDAFDDPALRAALLDPLGPGGDQRYRTRVFDHLSDVSAVEAPQDAPPDAVLLVDGVFLQRPELAGCWDLVVFVDVPFAVCLARALERDAAGMGGTEAVRERYAQRYIPAQRRYLAERRPRENADLVVENADLLRPLLVRGAPERSQRWS